MARYKEIVVDDVHRLEAPPVNFVTPEGATIFNFNRSAKFMDQYGYREWTSEELEAWHKQYDPPAPEPIVPTTCTKYQLVGVLKEYYPQVFEQLRQAYASNADVQFYWNTVNELDRTNADFIEAFEGLGFTAEFVEEVFGRL